MWDIQCETRVISVLCKQCVNLINAALIRMKTVAFDIGISPCIKF